MPPTSQPTMKNTFSTIPTWLRSDLMDSIQRIGNIITNIINLEGCVKTLKEHQLKETIPKSLSVSINIQVNSEQQEGLNSVVKEATKKFQTTLLDALLTARNQEIAKRRSDVLEESAKFKLKTRNLIQELLMENCLDGSDEEIEELYNHSVKFFDEQCATKERELRTEIFFKTKKKEKRMKELNERKAEERINQELNDPVVDELTKKVKQLENIVKKSSKKDVVKPNGGGQQGKTFKKPTTKGKNQKTNQNGHNGKNKPNNNSNRKGQGAGNGKKGRQPRSTPLMTRSDSKKSDSHKKLN